MQCDVTLETVAAQIEQKPNIEGENMLLSVDCKLAATAKAYEEKTVELVTDAYSTKYEMNLDKKQIKFEKLMTNIQDTVQMKYDLEPPVENIAAVMDLWCTPTSATVNMDGKEFSLSGELMVSMIAADEDGMPAYYEKTLPYQYAKLLEEGGEEVFCDPVILPVAQSFNITSGKEIDLRVELAVNAPVYKRCQCGAIADMELDESREKQTRDLSALTIYYADSGERIWNIASRYNTSMEAIMQENNLTEDMVRGSKMLLIPAI